MELEGAEFRIANNSCNITIEQAAMQQETTLSAGSEGVTNGQDLQAVVGEHKAEPAPKRPMSSESVLASPSKKASSSAGLSVDRTAATEAKRDNGDNTSSAVSHTPPDNSQTDCTLGEADFEGLSLDDYVTEDYQQKVQQLPRQWEMTELGILQRADGYSAATLGNSRCPMTFTIMSYNILSQDLMDLHPELYTCSSPQSLDWRYRRRLLVAEIAYHNVDVLSLQEVQENHFFDYIKPRLEGLGYTGCYQRRTGDKSDGCATLWKNDKFRLLQSTPVVYRRGGLLDRDNIALIVELQPLRYGMEASRVSHNPEDKVVIANTHLLFNPRRGDIKLAQLMILLAEIDRHAYLGPSAESLHHAHPLSWDSMGAERYCPVIMTGDFNMEPHCDLYKFIVGGTIEYEGLVIKDMSGQEEGWHGRTFFMQRHFLSPMYGVTDLCQYHSFVVERLRHSYQTYSQQFLPQRIANPDDNNKGKVFCHYNMEQNNSQVSGHSLQTETGKYPDTGRSHKIEGMPEARVSSDTASIQIPHPDHGDGQSQSNFSPGPLSEAGRTGSDLPPLMPGSSGRLSHHLNLFSAYQHKVQRLGEEPEVTTHHSQAECTVDYIFYSVDYKHVCVQEEEIEVRVVEEGHLKLMGRYGLMSGTELDELGSIPNSLLPSDHLCLIVNFLLL